MRKAGFKLVLSDSETSRWSKLCTDYACLNSLAVNNRPAMWLTMVPGLLRNNRHSSTACGSPLHVEW